METVIVSRYSAMHLRYFLATSYFAAESGHPPSVTGRNAWSLGMVAKSL